MNNTSKKCTFCAEEIKSEAIKCRHCGESLITSTQTIESKAPDKTNWGCLIIAIVVIIFVVYAVASSHSGEDISPQTSINSTSKNQNKDKEAEYHYATGLAHKIKGDDMLAITEYTRAIDLKPDFALAYYHRGLAEMDFSELKDSACNDLRKVVELGYSRASDVLGVFCK